jgi:hypothetical protein
VTRIRGRRSKQLLDDLKEDRKYWKLKQETLENSCVIEETMDLSIDRLKNAWIYFKVSSLRGVHARFWWAKPGRRRQVLRHSRRWKTNIKMDFQN